MQFHLMNGMEEQLLHRSKVLMHASMSIQYGARALRFVDSRLGRPRVK